MDADKLFEELSLPAERTCMNCVHFTEYGTCAFTITPVDCEGFRRYLNREVYIDLVPAEDDNWEWNNVR